MTNKIWWDQLEIDRVRTNNSAKTWPHINIWIEPQTTSFNFGPGEPGLSIHSIPCIDREPVVGDYIIFTEVCDTDYKGWITRVERINNKNVYYTLHPRTDEEEKHTNLIFQNGGWYIIDPKFVVAMEWEQTPAQEVIADYLQKNPNKKPAATIKQDPRCPKCGGALGSYMLAPYCKVCNIIQPEINGIFINRAY